MKLHSICHKVSTSYSTMADRKTNTVQDGKLKEVTRSQSHMTVFLSDNSVIHMDTSSARLLEVRTVSASEKDTSDRDKS